MQLSIDTKQTGSVATQVAKASTSSGGQPGVLASHSLTHASTNRQLPSTGAAHSEAQSAGSGSPVSGSPVSGSPVSPSVSLGSGPVSVSVSLGSSPVSVSASVSDPSSSTRTRTEQPVEARGTRRPRSRRGR